MSPTRTILAFGSGPGIGNHVVSHFASHNFSHAILLARNEDRLKNEDAAFVSKTNPSVKVDTLRVDLSDLDSIPAVLKEIDILTEGEDLEVVFFNAARIKGSGVLDVAVGEIEEDLRTTTLALYLVAQHFIPRLQQLKKSNPSSKPSLLVTNSHLPWAPVPQLLSLSLVKAAQRNLVQSLNTAFSESGIHVGLVSVEGVVAPENEKLNPRNIAEVTYGFYEAGEGLDVRVRE